MKIGILLRGVGVINLILFLSRSFSVQGREPYSIWFYCKNKQKNFNVGSYSGTYRLISFKLDMMIGITEVYILISVWVTMNEGKGHPNWYQNVKLIDHYHHIYSKTSWLHCLTHILADRDEIWCGVEAIQVEYSDTTFQWDLMIRGKKLLCYRLHQKTSTLACILTYVNGFGSNLVWWYHQQPLAVGGL